MLGYNVCWVNISNNTDIWIYVENKGFESKTVSVIYNLVMEEGF